MQLASLAQELEVQTMENLATGGELRARAALLECVLDALPAGLLIVNHDGRIELLNASLARQLGIDAQKFPRPETISALANQVGSKFGKAGGALAEALHQWRGGISEALGDSAKETVVHLGELEVRRRVRELRAPSGENLGWMEIWENVTGTLPDDSRRLQTEKLAAIGQLVSGIAHELNNPLTSIRGYAQLLLARGRRRDRVAHAEQIYRQAERAARIVQNLLFFARRARAERKPVNLNEIVERTVALRAYELKLENIEVQLMLEPGLPATIGDADQLQQVVLNLLVNAEQAILQGDMPPGQRNLIRVRTASQPGALHTRPPRPPPGRVALEICDSGPGIPAQSLERLFEPFYTTKPAGLGTGLGLSIVYGIVQEHAGEIYVEGSTDGDSALDDALRGARFVVELPVHRAAPQPRTRRPYAAPRITARPTTGKRKPSRNASAESRLKGLIGKRILVVEDELPVAELIRDVLRQAGMRVETELDSRSGLARALREPFDLILCDLRMPGVDGAAFHRELQRASVDAARRLAFVTGDTLSRGSMSFLKRAGLPYLAKPFFVEDLKRFVAHAFAQAAGKNSPGNEKRKDAKPARSE